MIKFLVELLPLLAFFIGYKTQDIFAGTLYMLIASVISIISLYIIEKQINKTSLISTVLILISGSLTLISGDSQFVKMKPTILYTLFAFILLYTNSQGRPAVKYLFRSTISMEEDKWKILNTKFMYFFFSMAIINEIIWRSYSESIWVNFKVFWTLPITMGFILYQIPFLLKHKLNDDI
ncbi:MAG: septation protein A [Rickettsiaceae bacterium]|nr:septation protein A [Rickettsiaceae bacterium]